MSPIPLVGVIIFWRFFLVKEVVTVIKKLFAVLGALSNSK